jgi:hypothetical protein
MAIDETAVCAGPGLPPIQAHLERSLRVQRCPTIASVPSSGSYATQSETPKESVAPCPRELTGENSPHYTNQPAKIKTDRVLSKYFLLVPACVTNAYSLSNNPLRRNVIHGRKRFGCYDCTLIGVTFCILKPRQEFH